MVRQYQIKYRAIAINTIALLLFVLIMYSVKELPKRSYQLDL